MTTETSLPPGAQLRQIRLGVKQWTLEEAARRSDGRLTVQAISRLERDSLKRPSFFEVVTYAQVLGLTPNEVARMYRLWTDGTEPREEPREIAAARSLLSRMPDGPRRAELLSRIEFAVAMTLALEQQGF